MKKYIPYIWVAMIVALFIAGGMYVDKGSKKVIQNQPTSSSDLQNLGPAPDFSASDHWLNSDPLTISGLKGKVVLVDFWTFSCINCIRTLPFVTHWYDTYKDKGLVVVGVHTPEFAFEKETANVSSAIRQFSIKYPVAQDNEYGTWNAYNNQYWPAEYLIDQNGNIVLTHFGEGNYDRMENAIRSLLGLNPEAVNQTDADLSGIGSPEMYFGTNRLQYLVPDQTPSSKATSYNLPASLALNNFAVSGQWQFNPESAVLTHGPGEIKLKFHSGKVHMVAQSDKRVAVRIVVDGKAQPDVMIQDSQLYTLFDSTDYSDHVIEIFVPDAGFKAFTFTFG